MKQVKWTHATALLAMAGLFGVGIVWSGCSSGGGTTDGGTDSGGSDVNQQQDTGGGDSGGNDSGGGDSGGNDGSIAVDASALDCNYYCSTIAAVCTGSHNQYTTNTACMDMCAKLTVGDAGATSGSTLACRMYHVSAAVSDPTLHCPHAGPYGFGGCGSENEDFCALYAAQCGSFGGNGACTAVFGALAEGDAGSFLNGSGNTKQCREYHLENAYNAGDTDGGGHCAHASASGGGVCQ